MSSTVRISELKNQLSLYLRRVREGEHLLVCDRDRVIARIEPAGGAGGRQDEDAWLDELERSGVVRRPAGKLGRSFLKRRPRVKGDVVGALLSERDEGR